MSNRPSLSSLILLFYQLLTASAQPHWSSRMQCNAGACKTAQLHFRIHLTRAPCALLFVGISKNLAMRKEANRGRRSISKSDARRAGYQARNADGQVTLGISLRPLFREIRLAVATLKAIARPNRSRPVWEKLVASEVTVYLRPHYHAQGSPQRCSGGSSSVSVRYEV
jgi:hypothetical protein